MQLAAGMLVSQSVILAALTLLLLTELDQLLFTELNWLLLSEPASTAYPDEAMEKYTEVECWKSIPDMLEVTTG